MQAHGLHCLPQRCQGFPRGELPREQQLVGARDLGVRDGGGGSRVSCLTQRILASFLNHQPDVRTLSGAGESRGEPQQREGGTQPQTVERREVGRHGPVGGGWTGPLITVDVKPKSTVCRRELKQNQANANRRPVPLPAEQPAGDGGSSWVTDVALEAAMNVISGAGVRSREFKQDGITVSSNHVSLCISVSIIFQGKLIMSPL